MLTVFEAGILAYVDCFSAMTQSRSLKVSVLHDYKKKTKKTIISLLSSFFFFFFIFS